jgi:hypothetical protein
MAADPIEHDFAATLVGDMGPHKWTCVIVEGSPEMFGSAKPVKVVATVDGVDLSTSLLPYRGRHMLPVKQSVLDRIGKAAGDTVSVRLRAA